MKRSRWIIASVVIILLILGIVFLVFELNTSDVSAPDTNQQSSNNTKTTTTGPLTLYYIAIDDKGQSGDMIGCGDSAVEVTTAEVTTDDVVKATFERILSNHEQWYGESGLYNVLYQSDLTFVSSSKANDTITVNLTGGLSLGGECDNPRVQAQLEMAAKKVANVDDVEIFINSKPLSEALSLK